MKKRVKSLRKTNSASWLCLLMLTTQLTSTITEAQSHNYGYSSSSSSSRSASPQSISQQQQLARNKRIYDEQLMFHSKRRAQDISNELFYRSVNNVGCSDFANYFNSTLRSRLETLREKNYSIQTMKNLVWDYSKKRFGSFNNHYGLTTNSLISLFEEYLSSGSINQDTLQQISSLGSQHNISCPSVRPEDAAPTIETVTAPAQSEYGRIADQSPTRGSHSSADRAPERQPSQQPSAPRPSSPQSETYDSRRVVRSQHEQGSSSQTVPAAPPAPQRPSSTSSQAQTSQTMTHSQNAAKLKVMMDKITRVSESTLKSISRLLASGKFDEAEKMLANAKQVKSSTTPTHKCYRATSVATALHYRIKEPKWVPNILGKGSAKTACAAYKHPSISQHFEVIEKSSVKDLKATSFRNSRSNMSKLTNELQEGDIIVWNNTSNHGHIEFYLPENGVPKFASDYKAEQRSIGGRSTNTFSCIIRKKL